MLFNSWEFWAFFAVVLPIYWLLPFRWQNGFLLVASYYFYGCWDWRFLPLIAFSTVMDFWLGQWIAATPPGDQRKKYVRVSVIANLALLGVFKYYNFFSHEFATFLQGFGIAAPLPVLNVILPVGISFYTFQSMSYVIDIARGKTTPAKSFLDFALYVSFFPHLVAGPIMRSGTKEHDPLGRGLLKQLSEPRRWRAGDFEEGLYHVTLGLFKKIVIGDNMASIVNMIFQRDLAQLTGPECLVGIYAFAWQIYGDFSGYSSIAQGVAKWMGVDLMFNFRMPYLAGNPSEFWHRWHISLSTWLRDYLYIPLGGSRGGEWKTYRNLMLTMTIGGIWHGANWTFIVWGAFHGAYLCAHRLLGAVSPGTARGWGRVAAAVGTFHMVCFGWLFFRAETIGQAMGMLRLMATDFRVTPMAVSILALVAFYALPLLAYEVWTEHGKPFPAMPVTLWPRRLAAYGYCFAMLLIFSPSIAHEFIYFQF
ncbi:MAG: MBOAT family O-acyltransferase [Bryobacteraceae bacterium]